MKGCEEIFIDVKTKNEFPLAFISNGTVIDHIAPGRAALLLRLFQLEKHQGIISLGMNLPSKRMKTKDIVKVDGWELSPEETSQIAILSPGITINIINDQRVVRKFIPKTPEIIEHLVICPNSNCITNREFTKRRFYVKQHKKETQLQCAYCEKCYYQNEIFQYAL